MRGVSSGAWSCVLLRLPQASGAPGQRRVARNALVRGVVGIEGLLKADLSPNDNIGPAVVDLVDALDLGAVGEADLMGT